MGYFSLEICNYLIGSSLITSLMILVFVFYYVGFNGPFKFFKIIFTESITQNREPYSRKGKCCECIAYHRNMGELPGCLFPPEVERTYDRSIEKFIETYKKY